MSANVALRTALVWRDEVMDDVVLDKPRPVTVGHSGKTTFTIPDIGLPKRFAIVRPGRRGYVLTLGTRRLYVAGDTENTQEMKSLKDIDIAFLPMNLPYTMTPEMVADAARAFLNELKILTNKAEAALEELK